MITTQTTTKACRSTVRLRTLSDADAIESQQPQSVGLMLNPGGVSVLWEIKGLFSDIYAGLS
jgi:hypothetical protein